MVAGHPSAESPEAPTTLERWRAGWVQNLVSHELSVTYSGRRRVRIDHSDATLDSLVVPPLDDHRISNAIWANPVRRDVNHPGGWAEIWYGPPIPLPGGQLQNEPAGVDLVWGDSPTLVIDYVNLRTGDELRAVEGVLRFKLYLLLIGPRDSIHVPLSSNVFELPFSIRNIRREGERALGFDGWPERHVPFRIVTPHAPEHPVLHGPTAAQALIPQYLRNGVVASPNAIAQIARGAPGTIRIARQLNMYGWLAASTALGEIQRNQPPRGQANLPAILSELDRRHRAGDTAVDLYY